MRASSAWSAPLAAAVTKASKKGVSPGRMGKALMSVEAAASLKPLCRPAKV